MTKEDFFNLKIDQTLFFGEWPRTITHLGIEAGDNYKVKFIQRTEVESWKDVCSELTLEQPKKKKRYWLWKVRQGKNGWEKTSTYVDEQGIDTAGQQVFLKWNINGDNIKCEDDFVEV